MSARTAKANLADAYKQLQLRWQSIQPQWDDEARRDFEREFIDALPGRIESANKAIEHVLELMAKVRNDCGDSPD